MNNLYGYDRVRRDLQIEGVHLTLEGSGTWGSVRHASVRRNGIFFYSIELELFNRLVFEGHINHNGYPIDNTSYLQNQE